MPNQRSSRSVSRERPVNAHDDGASIATTSGASSPTVMAMSSTLTRRSDSTIERSSSISTRSSPLRTPTSTPSARTSLWAAVRQELEQVAARQDAERLAALDDQERGAALHRLERDVERRVELDHADRRSHDLGDVGLQRVGVAEDAVEQRVLADRADEAGDIAVAFVTHDRCLGDRELLQHVDRLADLVVRLDGDDGGDAAALRLEDLLDADHLGAVGEAVLQQPAVRVELRQVVPARVGQDHD